MYNNIFKSKIGLLGTLVVGTILGINATKVEEDILSKDISSPTILVTQGLIVLTAILLIVTLIPSMRANMMSDINKMTIRDIMRLGAYAVGGIIFAFAAHAVLLQHGTNEVKLFKIIIGLLITGLIYFLSSNKNKKITIKKIILFIILSISAILFSME